MKVPPNMTTPKMKLNEGEEVVATYEGMRKKGIFGNRFGVLYITNQRVGFVKAIMKSGVISAAANAMGAKPMISFARGSVGAQRVEMKKLAGVELTGGDKPERIVIDPGEIDEVLGHLGG